MHRHREGWANLIAMYAKERKNTMMSIGEMLSAPSVPALTSALPMADIARRNRSAIKGAVTKFMGNSSRTNLRFRSAYVPSSWRFFIRETLRMSRKAENICRGTYIGTWNGNSAITSVRQGVSLLSQDRYSEYFDDLLVTTNITRVNIDLQFLIWLVSRLISIPTAEDISTVVEPGTRWRCRCRYEVRYIEKFN